ncbi:DNA-directed DNA polymerase epsilon, subunit B [Boothiomyces macroporosus]|uniref:DNA polymerase epsilon subunit n=1 Tax=Boothiomyces macroporosus TaxID=261099 RepID=A0AAD5UQK6_9FUNG|nr:DNA-directed DNA polymerase epsilon, subunit B [Boothiomyces macroporosus]
MPAIQYLEEFVEEQQIDQDNFLYLLDEISKQYQDNIIEKDQLQNVVREILSKNSDSSNDEVFQQLEKYLAIIDIFALPKFVYYPQQDVFALSKGERQFLGNVQEKSLEYRNRYELVKQRLLRNEVFLKPTFSADLNSYYKITPIIHLKGKPPGKYLLFGMFCEIQEGKLFIEDSDSYIEVKLSENLQLGNGIFTRGCFVLAEGDYTVNGEFIVETLAMPQPETRSKTLSCIPNSKEFFGGHPYDPNDYLLAELEKSEVSFTLEKLDVLFKGYSEAIIPFLFIFIGNFQSTSYVHSAAAATTYRENFDQLANIISKYPLISQNSHFIFIPGPNDPFGNMYSKPPIPAQYCKKLLSKVKNVTLASNPCRIKYCKKDILIFREDMMNIMVRNAAIPVPNDNIEKHLISTILDQGFLLPVPAEVKPIVISHYNAMLVYPLPDLVILADKFEAYQHEYEECQVVNPGSFPNNQFQFAVYQPAVGLVEPSILY